MKAKVSPCVCKERAIYNEARFPETSKIKAHNLRVAWKAVNIRSLARPRLTDDGEGREEGITVLL